MFVIGVVFDALVDVAERRDGVAELDPALLAGRRRDDFGELRRRRSPSRSRRSCVAVGHLHVRLLRAISDSQRFDDLRAGRHVAQRVDALRVGRGGETGAAHEDADVDDWLAGGGGFAGHRGLRSGERRQEECGGQRERRAATGYGLFAIEMVS